MGDVIYKYQIGFYTEIEVPKGNMPLSAGFQKVGVIPLEEAFVWIRHDADAMAEKETLIVRSYATGQEFSETPGYFLGSIHSKGGFVFHVFLDHKVPMEGT